MLSCINGSVNAALTCIPQLSAACREWQLQRAAAALGSRRRELVQGVPSDVGNDFVLSHQAYCYHGQTLLASDKCGEAIRSLQESEKCKCGWDGIIGSDDGVPVQFCYIVLICSPIKILISHLMEIQHTFEQRQCFGFFWGVLSSPFGFFFLSYQRLSFITVLEKITSSLLSLT